MKGEEKRQRGMREKAGSSSARERYRRRIQGTWEYRWDTYRV
jgi:hypothetical protein